MKINIYNPNNNKISGTLTNTEKKIIDAEFSKAKPGDSLEIELLDKKGFISEEKVKEIINIICTNEWENCGKRLLDELGLMKK